MASITKHGKKWRAQIARSGTRKSKVFPAKQEAKDWAANEESRLKDERSTSCRLPFGDVMRRYGLEVSPTKRGHLWEVARIEKWRVDPLGKIRMCDLSADDLADWRDKRLRQVAPGTVRRERNLMSAILTQARREWRYIDANPMADVSAPKEPPPRDRLVSDDELEKLVFVAGGDLSTKRARAIHAFRFALETGMRAGEILSLHADALDLDQRVAYLSRTKNGDSRDVPLSTEAVLLIGALPNQERLFDMSSADLDAAWRRIRDRAGIDGLTFHDSRHSAVTKLSRKLDVLALARMIGHRDIKQLMVYYNAPANELAKLLD
ncbi:tyrosine-type recombinase/integrase [Pelagimonas varians]|uniref:Site-specific tyrosine recombinase XerD n=1 Tax=Pelagimonas varians TaxID=696760 RepID=A0A238JYC0_9RHOB|nr:site-specific integrase [Pelagimonas varians]PYG33096.1 site-specific recombinase XerD [Pelagimonas varians]SMX35668.1 site-specific tyrosine recombinase XerD [Pelagimonas varians]